MYDTQNALLIPLAQSGDKEAFDKMVLCNIGLVKSIVIRFRDRGVEFDDLIQIGTIGLIKAVKNFNSSIGTQFSTYAVPMIIGEIKKFLRDDGIIKISRELKRQSHEIQHKRDEYIKENGFEPTISELAHLCGMEEESAIRALEATTPLLSFSSAIGETTLENIVGTDNISELAESISLRQAIEKLCETDKKIIYLRYFRGLSQGDVGKNVGMTQVMVSRREKKIIEFLKNEMK
ncbi:MAG: sigma-70 family RNA polymerase sigma factor [Clostridia bacterium]